MEILVKKSPSSRTSSIRPTPTPRRFLGSTTLPTRPLSSRRRRTGWRSRRGGGCFGVSCSPFFDVSSFTGFSSGRPRSLTATNILRFLLFAVVVYILDRYASVSTGWAFEFGDEDVGRRLPCRDDNYMAGAVSQTVGFPAHFFSRY